jgi:hypothetical protein
MKGAELGAAYRAYQEITGWGNAHGQRDDLHKFSAPRATTPLGFWTSGPKIAISAL